MLGTSKLHPCFESPPRFFVNAAQAARNPLKRVAGRFDTAHFRLAV
jgi:hypothetical protein